MPCGVSVVMHWACNIEIMSVDSQNARHAVVQHDKEMRLFLSPPAESCCCLSVMVRLQEHVLYIDVHVTLDQWGRLTSCLREAMLQV